MRREEKDRKRKGRKGKGKRRGERQRKYVRMLTILTPYLTEVFWA
jgi:hypothetical protein